MIERRISMWPVLRQLRRADVWGLGSSAQSERSHRLEPRTARAEHVVRSVCPYCAVGCGQRIFVENGRVSQIEGDPDSPISRGRLCPKGAASKGLVTSPLREYRVKYRRPFGTEWEELELDQAMDMIADRVIATRRETWQESDEQGRTLRRSLGVANLGGATLDNEENYTIKKLMTSLELARQELMDQGRRVAIGIVALGVAAAFALVAFGTLVASLVLLSGLPDVLRARQRPPQPDRHRRIRPG